MPPKATIVINTYNRALSLEHTLKSLYYLEYPDFEVIVVNGPSRDNTEEILVKFKSDIKVGKCPIANLSASRNIGICMAKGDIIAFIDDDAVPEPEWLNCIIAGYDAADIGGVGGPVYNHTGYELQAQYILCDRFGDARFENNINPTEYFNFPLSSEYCGLLGTNSSFRREVLLEVKGFDEEYDYYLDETDLCVRIIDSGYKIKFVDNAYIHHKFAPSHIRNQNKLVLNWYPIAKNKSYFSIKHSLNTNDFTSVIHNINLFINNITTGLKSGLECGSINESQYKQCINDLNNGIKQGFYDAFINQPEFITDAKLSNHEAGFKSFSNYSINKRLVICYISQDFPPEHNGGIGRFIHDLAKGIAKLGHYVHVVTTGKNHNTVDLEDGVWVHRIVPEQQSDKTMLPQDLVIPDSIWNRAYAAYKEVNRINSHHKIDIVESPIWDVEGLACVLDKNLFTVVNLETTYSIAVHSHKEWQRNLEYKYNHIDKIIAAEKYICNNASALHAISKAIVTSIEEENQVTLPLDKIGIVPLGVVDRSRQYSMLRSDDDIVVLFVGRLEDRKGIDILLASIPDICERYQKVRFIIVGDDSIKDENGKLYREEFDRSYHERAFMERVKFTGKVSEDELYHYYANCDIFVAPSKFESFGLIFLEAMQFAKPVIGCRVGGMVEIIQEGINGYLAEPGDSISLCKAIEELIVDSGKRKHFGEMSRKIFTERYTSELMTEDTLRFYRKLLDKSSAVA